MLVNHTNIQGSDKKIYCFRLASPVILDSSFIEKECRKCPFFNGDALGTGVECLFDDGCTDEDIGFWDAADSEKHTKMYRVRLGLASEEEVDRTLIGTPYK